MSSRGKAFFRPKGSLRSLRIAFFSLGIALLGGLLALFLFMQERLDEARLEREQMVASRVFDELEREVSAFLDGESERARYGALQETNPGSWAPFVIGYFKREGAAPEVVTAGGLSSENHRRVTWALGQVDSNLAGHSSLGENHTEFDADGENNDGAKDAQGAPPPKRERLAEKQAEPTVAPVPVAKPQKAPKKSTSGSEIIQQLNRAQERRKAPAKSSAGAPEAEEDQFLDYTESY